MAVGGLSSGDEGESENRSDGRPDGREDTDAVIRQRLWTRSFVLITVENFLLAMNFLLLLAVLTKFATERLGASTGLAGFAAGIFIIGAVFSRPFCGRWIHRLGQTRMLYVGVVLSLGLTLAYLVADSIALLLVIRFLHGAAFGSAHVAAGTIVAGVAPKERYGEGIGYYTLSQILGNALGPFVALLLIRHASFEAVIIGAAAALGIGLAIIPLLSVKDLELTAEQVEETRGFKLSNYVEPKAVPIGLVATVLYLCFTSVLSFLALYSESIGLMETAGVFFLVYAAVVFLARPFVGRRFDTRGENAVMYPAILVFAAGLALFSQARYGWMLLLAAVVIGAGFGAIQAGGQTIAVKITPLHRVGLATSTFFLFADIGVGVSPILCGLAIPYLGYRGTYLAVATTVAACLLLYFALHGRRAGGPRPASMETSGP